MGRIAILAVSLALLAGLACVYFMFDPARSGLFPHCPFLMMTGFKCPGCGSQRAIHSLLHLDFATAFRYNALLVLSLPFVLLCLFAAVCRVKLQRLYMAVNSRLSMSLFTALALLWWVARNVAGW